MYCSWTATCIIACASVYCKPGSKSKTDLYDHIAEAHSILSTKYQKGLHFIIAGDTNELNLTPILNLSPNLIQIVRKPTRVDPVTGVEAILDPVITTLASYYQAPKCLPPLDCDPESNGKASDHRIVMVIPITAINNHCARSYKEIKSRPISQLGMINMRNWLQNQDWSEVYEAKSASIKAELLQNMLVRKFHELFPEKTHRISSDDQPWITHKLKLQDRRKKREFNKHRKSEKWQKLNTDFKKSVSLAKKDFYKRMVSELTSKNTSKWYSTLKKMTSHDQQKNEKLIIQEINHLSDREQIEKLADHFSKIPNEYEQLNKDDIDINPIKPNDIPQFKEVQIWDLLTQLKTNKSTVQGDISSRIYKELAAYISEPLTHVYNASLQQGEYPQIYKFEVTTPVPKKYPVESMDQLRNISGLLTADKILEKLLSEIIFSDMKEKADTSQFGNTKHTSIQHYLIKMIHRIQTALDVNSRREKFAVIANMIDWNSAFVRQCPILGIKSFQKNGVRNSLIPLLVFYFQERYQSVKWRGITSTPRRINGGGPQGATIGILEYLSQTNNSADIVNSEDRFKFVDDLTVLEIVNLLTIGISSFNIKHQIPNDIREDNKYIPPENLRSQLYLDTINTWTQNHKMKINQTKTKTMIFNHTNNYQFTTRLKIDNETLEIVNHTKLLGTIITNDLTWDQNTNYITKKAFARMELLKKLSKFQPPKEDLKQIYITYIRSLLEQSSTVWHSSLTVENSNDLERVQKVALKIILKDSYKSYENALETLELESLASRRENLSLIFAQKCLKNPKMKYLFPPNNKTHEMKTRESEDFYVNHTNTTRLQRSPITYMQNLLNKEVHRRKIAEEQWCI